MEMREILRQLKNILSFALDAVFDEDKSTVERICRKKKVEEWISSTVRVYHRNIRYI